MGYHNSTFNPTKHKRFIPINEDKYIGKDYPVSRSTWEYKVMSWCDSNQSIIKWSSETIQIQYYDPIKKKNRRYYPDLILFIKDINGDIKKYIVEIKPEKETIMPTKIGNKKETTYMYEFCTYQTNMAKWKAAQIYCKKYGYIFKILTEKDIFKDGKV
jgi:hypothetical protein